MVRSHYTFGGKNMKMMDFVLIAQHTASRIGTAIDRCDIEYLKPFNCTVARVWLSNGWIFDIEDNLNAIREYNGGRGEYIVRFRDERYKLVDEMDEEEFSTYIHYKYMDRLEAEEDMRDDN